MPKRVTVRHRDFEPIEVDTGQVLEFAGLPGFPEARRFIVRAHDRGSVFSWLVCLDLPDLAFVIVNPWHFFPSYAPPIDARTLRRLGAARLEEVEVVAIASFDASGAALNLAAPLVIHAKTRRGMQVVLDAPQYSTHAPLPRPAAEPGSGAPTG